MKSIVSPMQLRSKNCANVSAEDLDSIVQQENAVFASGVEPRQVAQLGGDNDAARRV